MKKIALKLSGYGYLVIFLCSACFLTGCSLMVSGTDKDSEIVQKEAKEGDIENSLLRYCDEQTKEFLTQEDIPVRLVYRCLHEASQEYEITDRDTIQLVLNAILEIQVEGETDMMASDRDDVFVFTMENGDICSFSFNDHHFQSDKKLYELSGDDSLWKLAKKIQQPEKE